MKNRIEQGTDAVLAEAWDAFVAFLRSEGARVTCERRIVLEHVLSRDDHFRADEVAIALADGPHRVSRGTVYRTLALLVESGFLQQIRDSDTHSHYERAYRRDSHEHMVCEECGKFIEFSLPDIGSALEHACRRSGFSMRSHRVVVNGICDTCQKKPR